MSGIFTNIVAFLVAISILVAFHEFGHYWVARRLGVKVLRYSVGFGKPLYTWRGGRDQTEYCIASLPLGGYVKMLDEREAPVAEDERHRAFNRQALWRRTAIVAAGPAFNFLFAIAVYWAIFVAGTTEMRPVVGDVPEGTPAAEAGVQSGEEIVAVGNRSTPTWDKVLVAMLDASLSRSETVLTVRDDSGIERQRTLDLRGLGRLGDDPNLLGTIGVQPWRPSLDARVGELVGGGAAETAGLLPGDLIVAVDGAHIDGWTALVNALQERAGESVRIEVERDGALQALRVDLGEAGSQRGVLGVRPDVPEGLYEEIQHTVRYGPVSAIGEAAADTYRTSVLTLQVLWGMITGQASLNNLSGPITIGQYAGDTASSGLVSFLKFLAIVSISLGVLNLLPIPMLDGGHLLYFFVEAVKGSPVSEHVQIYAQYLGMLLLLLLMSLAFYNDIARLAG
ncbi:MAG: RIP metalloprotease RseP [Ectothiorhodospiraceae bacterium]|nr:RIP metalloprotease RseP [Ectothiorhodospiraceae bacterium]